MLTLCYEAVELTLFFPDVIRDFGDFDGDRLLVGASDRGGQVALVELREVALLQVAQVVHQAHVRQL